MSVDWELTTLAGCSENLDKLRKPITKSKREAGSIPYYGASGIVATLRITISMKTSFLSRKMVRTYWLEHTR